MSVLHVYFGKSTALYYRRVLRNTWVEAFSTVGNILSIVMGVSLVAIFELSFFLIKYLIIAFKLFIKQNRKQNINKEKKITIGSDAKLELSMSIINT
uniref:Uncharacterized protein n=1 Tax=Glossina palpalis gambiensis TaxID=67801 RepID=A0A1B0B8L6_9MUSC